MPAPVLHLVAGPNGAGKSTLVFEVLQPITHLPFVNADLIAADRWPANPLSHAYEASRSAAAERERLMAEGSSFITETVFSHQSKVDLVADAARRGYLVFLHVVLVPASLPVPRVAARVARGGHDVPEEKVRRRYQRLWPLVRRARDLVETATFYDNTRADRPFVVVARYERGEPVDGPRWPAWTPAALTAAAV